MISKSTGLSLRVRVQVLFETVTVKELDSFTIDQRHRLNLVIVVFSEWATIIFIAKIVILCEYD